MTATLDVRPVTVCLGCRKGMGWLRENARFVHVESGKYYCTPEDAARYRDRKRRENP